ncbi:7-cyano-7-deazaguanine synthase QueC [Candidatus Peregrinibacteria bacterium]|nr:7-cyano-7-deazaguanine synthase QueC [Candidatus Peregrinibacteria bacterium]
MPKIPTKSALILLSGGQDSTTCLAWALKRFKNLHAITFDYGQRHKIELKAAKKIAKIVGIPIKIQKIDLFHHLTKSALTHDQKITTGSKNQPPSTFVPGRNLIFLSTAAIYANQLGMNDLITGVCQTDFSGYPDCRNEFIKSLEKTLKLAMNYHFKIHTPLMWLTKGQTVNLIKKHKKLELLKHSHTCYEGMRPACAKCPACKLRLKGFKEAKTVDNSLEISAYFDSVVNDHKHHEKKHNSMCSPQVPFKNY